MAFFLMDNKLYIGSSENLVKRFNEHIKNQKSNIKLQRAIFKYDLNNFYYIIFEFYNLNDKVLFIDVETMYLSSFKIEYLYNFKLIAHSMLGYKHTIETKQKMLNRYNKEQHPFLGKHHTMNAKWKISAVTKGINSPMFGKKHTERTKELISLALSKSVYIYKIVNDKLELKEIFPNSMKLAKKLNLNKTTLSRYKKKSKIILWKSDKCILKRFLINIDL